MKNNGYLVTVPYDMRHVYIPKFSVYSFTTCMAGVWRKSRGSHTLKCTHPDIILHRVSSTNGKLYHHREAQLPKYSAIVLIFLISSAGMNRYNNLFSARDFVAVQTRTRTQYTKLSRMHRPFHIFLPESSPFPPENN